MKGSIPQIVATIQPISPSEHTVPLLYLGNTIKIQTTFVHYFSHFNLKPCARKNYDISNSDKTYKTPLCFYFYLHKIKT